MEKYGFIYLWYDRKRKMFYLGSHWGTINDGYICSSNRMRDAYRRRPNDFKRRIIQNNVSRETLLDEEHKWLGKIPDNELGKRYYNLRKHKWGHWSTDENKRSTIGQKISEKNKGRRKTNSEIENIKKFMLGKKNSLGYKHTEEAKKKIGMSSRSEERKIKLRVPKKFPRTNEHRKNMSLAQKGQTRKNDHLKKKIIIFDIEYESLKHANLTLGFSIRKLKKLGRFK